MFAINMRSVSFIYNLLDLQVKPASRFLENFGGNLVLSTPSPTASSRMQRPSSRTCPTPSHSPNPVLLKYSNSLLSFDTPSGSTNHNCPPSLPSSPPSSHPSFPSRPSSSSPAVVPANFLLNDEIELRNFCRTASGLSGDEERGSEERECVSEALRRGSEWVCLWWTEGRCGCDCVS